MGSKSSLTTVASYTNTWEAHLAKGKLEAEGILAFVQSQKQARMSRVRAQVEILTHLLRNSACQAFVSRC